MIQSNTLKLLDLVVYYFDQDDLESAVRILSMIAEQILVSQKPERLIKLLQEVLARDPENIAALRLQVRYYSWHKDDYELERTLQQMADASNLNESVEDERFALSQLIVLNPEDINISNRLRELADEQKAAESKETDGVEEQVSNEEVAVEASDISINGGELDSDNGFVAVYSGEVSIEDSDEQFSLDNAKDSDVKPDIDSEHNVEAENSENESQKRYAVRCG